MTKHNQLSCMAIMYLVTFNCLQGMILDRAFYVTTQDNCVMSISYAHIKHMNVLFTMLNKNQRSTNSAHKPLQFPHITSHNLKIVSEAHTQMRDGTFGTFWQKLEATDYSNGWKRPERGMSLLSPLQKTLVNSAEQLSATDLSILCLFTVLPKDILIHNSSIAALLDLTIKIINKTCFTNRKTIYDGINDFFDPTNDFQLHFLPNAGLNPNGTPYYTTNISTNIIAITPDGNTIITNTECPINANNIIYKFCTIATAYDFSDPNHPTYKSLKDIRGSITFPSVAAISDNGEEIFIGSNIADESLVKYNTKKLTIRE